MLEPLIVLTVLNCIFMFSSTVTTCALWWQYRNHRCCFKKDSMRHDLSRMKTTCPGRSSKKNGNGRQDSTVNGSDRQDSIVNGSDRRSNSTIYRDSKSSKRNSKQKSKSNMKYLLQERISSGEEVSSIYGSRDLEEKTRMSEASQTANEARSAVVMEYSTVQKIVQILDNDVNLSATRMAIREMNPKHHTDEKKVQQILEEKSEPESVTVYEAVLEE
nr:uncharacterized protein LOC117604213 [Osmia lignaria]